MSAVLPQPVGASTPDTTPDPFRRNEAVHFAQLRYDYSDSALAALQRDVPLPERLRHAVPRRQADFLAGRHCVRAALCAAGLAAPPSVGVGDHGAPVWPEGYTGSITHCNGWAMCAVAPSQRVDAIGIDLEALMPDAIARSVCGEIASPAELALLGRASMPFEAMLTLLFSAKESLFKALHPSIRRYIDFTDVEASAIDPDIRALELRLVSPLSEQHPRGKPFEVAFGWHEGYVLTRCLQASATGASLHPTSRSRRASPKLARAGA